MITNISIANFGPIRSLEWNAPDKINLIIGKNGSGKTFLLKAIYVAIRTVEEYKRGDDRRELDNILAEKLDWTFQTEKIGDLTSRGADTPLSYKMNVDEREFKFSFGRDTEKKIGIIQNQTMPRSSNSIFLPAKEVLSLYNIILLTRERDRLFGFDDTYYDLAKALKIQPQRGRNYSEFSQARQKLEGMLGGRVSYEEGSGKWIFKKGNSKFSMGVTAEGIKKIAILDTLLGNRFLDCNSTIFIDEPESALHPEALSKFMEIIVALSRRGIQFFIASHSYFVIKKLYLLAKEGDIPIPVQSQENGEWVLGDLRYDMPDNPIISEAIRLYDEEVEMSLGGAYEND